MSSDLDPLGFDADDSVASVNHSLNGSSDSVNGDLQFLWG